MNTGTNTVIIVNVYLPYQCAGNEDEYLEKLDYLNVVLDELNTTCYVVLGDLDANIRDTNNSICLRGIWLTSVAIITIVCPHNYYCQRIVILMLAKRGGQYHSWTMSFPVRIFMITYII